MKRENWNDTRRILEKVYSKMGKRIPNNSTLQRKRRKSDTYRDNRKARKKKRRKNLKQYTKRE